MKRFLLLVVLPAAAIAALTSQSKQAEAPGASESAGGDQPAAPTSDPLGIKSAIEALRQRLSDALQAAKDARAQKEAELRGEYEAMRKGRT